MARVITRNLYDVERRVITVVPIGDIHIGAAACDEARLKAVIERVKSEADTYWIGMGDFVDAINRSDPRFDPASLAPWIGMENLPDLAKAEIDRLLGYLKPIASKCLCVLTGNHEAALTKHYERDVFGSIVTSLKEAGNFAPDYKLALDYSGWLRLNIFYGPKAEKREAVRPFDWYLHHGFVGGRLAGGKALGLQRLMWSHNADITLMGHSHNTAIQVEAVEELNKTGNIEIRKRIGAFTGTFLRSVIEGASTYSEVKGYLPLPISGVEIRLTAFKDAPTDRIHVATAI